MRSHTVVYSVVWLQVRVLSLIFFWCPLGTLKTVTDRTSRTSAVNTCVDLVSPPITLLAPVYCARALLSVGVPHCSTSAGCAASFRASLLLVCCKCAFPLGFASLSCISLCSGELQSAAAPISAFSVEASIMLRDVYTFFLPILLLLFVSKIDGFILVGGTHCITAWAS